MTLLVPFPLAYLSRPASRFRFLSFIFHLSPFIIFPLSSSIFYLPSFIPTLVCLYIAANKIYSFINWALSHQVAVLVSFRDSINPVHYLSSASNKIPDLCHCFTIVFSPTTETGTTNQQGLNNVGQYGDDKSNNSQKRLLGQCKITFYRIISF